MAPPLPSTHGKLKPLPAFIQVVGSSPCVVTTGSDNRTTALDVSTHSSCSESNEQLHRQVSSNGNKWTSRQQLNELIQLVNVKQTLVDKQLTLHRCASLRRLQPLAPTASSSLSFRPASDVTVAGVSLQPQNTSSPLNASSPSSRVSCDVTTSVDESGADGTRCACGLPNPQFCSLNLMAVINQMRRPQRRTWVPLSVCSTYE